MARIKQGDVWGDFESCFTCKHCFYEMTRKSHVCRETSETISRPAMQICDKWKHNGD